MRLNFSQVMKDIDGSDVRELKDNGLQTITLGIVAARALNIPTEANSRESGENKVMGYVLGIKTYQGGEVDLTIDEAAYLKRKLGEFPFPVLAGQALIALEAATKVI